jgi:hypothetical protein
MDTMIKPTQLRKLLSLLLKDFDKRNDTSLWSNEAIELLLLTAAQETHCGRWLWQNIDVPAAYGLYQMEEVGYQQATQYLVRFVPTYRIPPYRHIIWNHGAATFLARAYYASWPEPLPETNDVLAIARYYKKYWNTVDGAATVESAIEKYYRYAIERPI